MTLAKRDFRTEWIFLIKVTQGKTSFTALREAKNLKTSASKQGYFLTDVMNDLIPFEY